MASILQLINAVRSSAGRSDAERLELLVGMADSEPTNPEIQGVAAYRAWTHGDDETALRLAKRADTLGCAAFPVLLVLTATHASGSDPKALYEYAKRLVEIPRNADKTAGFIVKTLAGSRLFNSSARAAELERIAETTKIYDDWVAWARDYVQSHVPPAES